MVMHGCTSAAKCMMIDFYDGVRASSSGPATPAFSANKN